MKKPYVLKEYDIITYREEFALDSKYCVVNKKDYQELENYINSFDSSYDENDIRFFLQITSKGIVAQNYVGLIQLDSGCQFQIMPKIELADRDGVDRTNKIFMEMLSSLKSFSSKSFNHANVQINKMNIFEIFIFMYVEHVERLIKHGLKSSYEVIEENSPFFKGKLQVTKHIKANLANKASFYVEHDEFLLNRPENRLIKASLHKLLRLTTNNDNERRIRQALASFEEVKESTNYSSDFDKVIIDRNTKEYEILMLWSKVILFNQNFTPFSGTSNAISLLFPMEKIFESYVAEKMKRIFSPYDWEISPQNQTRYLFDIPKMFALIPDIVARKNGQTIILDTKWKKLNPNSKNKYGITSSDMYQMYIYSQKHSVGQNKPYVYLLYPYYEEVKGLEIPVFKTNEGVNVEVFFVNLADIDVSLTLLKHKMEESLGELSNSFYFKLIK